MPVRHIWVDEIVTRRVPVLKWQTDEGVLYASEYEALEAQQTKARKASAAFSNEFANDLSVIKTEARISERQNFDFNIWVLFTRTPIKMKELADRAAKVWQALKDADREIYEYQQRIKKNKEL